MNLKSIIPTIALCLISFFAHSQRSTNTAVREASFDAIEGRSNTFRFVSHANNLPVIPIAGSPSIPFFGHYWEFGDGNFSFQVNPTHTYTFEPNSDAILFLTNNYDNGSLPTTKPKRPKTSGLATIITSLPYSYLPPNKSMLLRHNHDPKPNEEMVCIVSYKNPALRAVNGKLFLFFNDATYRQQHFNFAEGRTHFGESRSQTITSSNIIAGNYSANVQSVLQKAQNDYQDFVVWDTGLMQSQEERNLFTTLNTTAAMLQDTNATISIRAIFVPNNGGSFTENLLEMSIVASHDPNKISVSKTKANFRKIHKKEFIYTVQFENTAEGSADSITIDCTIPKGMDPKSINIKSTYLKDACPPCEEVKNKRASCISQQIINNKLVRFTFHNILLPGKQEAKDREDSQGFVKYGIKPTKYIKKKTVRNRAEIYFDKEKAVATNLSSTKFIPGISLGIKGGFNYYPNSLTSNYAFGGLTVSPYKSEKFYLQAELMVGARRTNDTISLISVPGADVDTLLSNVTDCLVLDIVPVQVRKKLNRFLSAGVGSQLSIRQCSDRIQTKIMEVNPESKAILNTSSSFTSPIRSYQFNPSLFADVTFRLVKIGPAIGLRYHLSLSKNINSHLHLYAVWKF